MKDSKGWQIVAHVMLMTLALFTILPFILLFISSISDETSIAIKGYSFFPESFSLSAYQYLWARIERIGSAYGITIFVTIVGTSIGLMMTAMLAYALARKNLPFRRTLAFLVVFTLLFNGGLVPTYWVYTQIFDVKNSLFAYIAPYLLLNGFGVLVMRTFFISTIPEEIIDAAKIDGAGEIRTFFSVVLPMSTPVLAAIGLLKGIAYWNDWFNGMIFITDPNLFSIQNLLNRMLSDIQFLATSDLAARASTIDLPTTSFRMAIAVIGIIPILVAYPFFQRWFIKGLTIGGVKG